MLNWNFLFDQTTTVLFFKVLTQLCLFKAFWFARIEIINWSWQFFVPGHVLTFDNNSALCSTGIGDNMVLTTCGACKLNWLSWSVIGFRTVHCGNVCWIGILIIDLLLNLSFCFSLFASVPWTRFDEVVEIQDWLVNYEPF